MEHQKFQTGAFVFTRARGLDPRDPTELLPLVAQHNLDPSIIPKYPGDRTAISRAISQASSGLYKEGYLLRHITRNSTKVIYGIVKEDRDVAEQKLDHEFEGRVSWSPEPDPSVVQGNHPIARRVADAYQELRGKIVADDWSCAITAYLESHDAARVRGDGRVYWVPPQRLSEIRQFGAFLQEVGIDLILCELEPETRAVVQDVVHDTIDDQLDRLQAEVNQFYGTQRPSTYVRRLDEYQRLRQRAVLYREALGVGVERTESVLSELEQKVTSMLELRKQTVIHHDSTQEQASVPTAENNPTLKFGGATFAPVDSQDPGILTFVSDDETAKTSAKSLESMGLAGKWLQAGPVQASIRNSGPEGAAVSISIRLPENGDLASAVMPLTNLGIELLF